MKRSHPWEGWIGSLAMKTQNIDVYSDIKWNIEIILNSMRPLLQSYGELKEISTSNLTFGFEAYSVFSDRNELIIRLREAIIRFEPRIEEAEVNFVDENIEGKNVGFVVLVKTTKVLGSKRFGLIAAVDLSGQRTYFEELEFV